MAAMVRPSTLWILLGALSSLRAADQPAGAAGTKAPAKDGEPVFARVFVIGASASAGFRTRDEAGETVTLAKVLDAALRVEHGEVRSASSSLLFINPIVAAETCARQAAAARPTLVVAVDFLFWFGYGFKAGEAQRLADLEKGLKLLERFACPVVIARIPDMSEAVGEMLDRRQVPAPETLRALNQRIDEWAEARGNIAVMPLAEFLDAVKAGKEARAGATKYPPGSLRRILQRDNLHPTVEGLAGIAVGVLETLAQRTKAIASDAFERDAAALAARVLAAAREGKGDAGEEGAGQNGAGKDGAPPSEAGEPPPDAPANEEREGLFLPRDLESLILESDAAVPTGAAARRRSTGSGRKCSGRTRSRRLREATRATLRAPVTWRRNRDDAKRPT
jgi:hypothetical protein